MSGGGHTALVPGQRPDGQPILAVLLKRTFEIVPDGDCRRAGEDAPLFGGDVHWGDTLNSTVRHECDLVPFRLATDVYVDGAVYAPGGRAVRRCEAMLRVGGHERLLSVSGERSVALAGTRPVFSEPEPFERMPLRYERAYGGIDVRSQPGASWPYPPNPLGRGFVIGADAAALDGLALPNLEDPARPLSPDNLAVGRHDAWERQPEPANFGCYPRTAWYRARFAGVMPADRAFERATRAHYAKLVPPEARDAYVDNGFADMDFRFFSAASAGLAIPYLEPGEPIVTRSLVPEGELAFALPADRPRLRIDIGEGGVEPTVVVHTVLLRLDERRVDVTWRAAVDYPGPEWLPSMERLEIELR